jgi:hypothetical protein
MLAASGLGAYDMYAWNSSYSKTEVNTGDETCDPLNESLFPETADLN